MNKTLQRPRRKKRSRMRASEPIGSCGIKFPAWKILRGGQYSESCSFQDELKPYLTLQHLPFGECFKDCEEEDQCTHFVYDGSTWAENSSCLLMSWPMLSGGDKAMVQASGSKTVKTCGFFLRYQPTFFDKYWPYFAAGAALLTAIGELEISSTSHDLHN